MAAPSTAGDEGLNAKLKSPNVTPQKVRELLNEGIAADDSFTENDNKMASSESANGVSHTYLPCESTSKEAFLSRVETFTSLKWAGKPLKLSPHECAKYGWINVESDMLKCSSCQAFLCATLQPTMDITKYKERQVELSKALSTAHEMFCFWPNNPSPARFWTLPIEDTAALLSGFLDRFRELWRLDVQLPSLKYEDLKDMPLTEDSVSILLQLVEEELKRREEMERSLVKLGSEILPAHVASCVLAVCGWTSSPSSLRLPVIQCSYCMRKVGLWGFQQIECPAPALEPDNPSGPPSTPVPTHDRREERLMLSALSPRRMITRSQDTATSQTEQGEKTLSPIGARTRSRDSHSPSPIDRPDLEAAGSAFRSNRPVTRSMGEVGTTGYEVPSSPQRKVKRLRLCSSSSSETSSAIRNFFNPVSQHKDWCPWISVARTQESRSQEEAASDQSEATEKGEPGWKEVLRVLCNIKKSMSSADGVESMSVPDKSTKVFRIFRQWQVTCSS